MNAKKAAHLAGALYRARFKNESTPLVASVILTNRCNLRCPYCGRWERPGDELAPERWIALVKELGDLGCVRLSVTGGEPLLFDGIDGILKTARQSGMRININTNGVLAPKKADTLALCDSVTISLDGTEVEHDAIRGKGTYDKAMNAARLAREMGKDLVFYTVLSRHNLQVLEHVAQKARELGGKAFFQPGTYYDFDGIKKNPEAPEVPDYRRAIDELMRMKGSGYPIGNSKSGLRYLRQWPDAAHLRCYGGKLFVRIEADGKLRLCGRDGDPGEVSVAQASLAESIALLDEAGCTSCWSAARVEFNLLAGGNLGALLNFLVN